MTPSEELISSRMFGGRPITLPITGPAGASAFNIPVGMLRFGAFLPVT